MKYKINSIGYQILSSGTKSIPGLFCEFVMPTYKAAQIHPQKHIVFLSFLKPFEFWIWT